MTTIERYGDLAVFVRVVDLGSFTRAAKDLGMSTSQASRAVARLEDRLGTRLLHRTTRRLSSTEAGRALHERAGALLAELDEVEGALRDHGGAVRGTLRVTMPIQFGIRFIAPLAAQFAERYPDIRFDLSYDDRRVDLVAEGFDLAIRAASLADSALMARKLGRTRSLTVASPDFLARHGTPEHPRELAALPALLYAHHGAPVPWRFRGPDGETLVKPSGRFVANNVEGLLAVAVAGAGVARLPDAIAARELRQGQLVRILAAWEDEVPIWAVYPPGKHLSPKVRTFVDFLVEALAAEPWLQCDSCPDAQPDAQPDAATNTHT